MTPRERRLPKLPKLPKLPTGPTTRDPESTAPAKAGPVSWIPAAQLPVVLVVAVLLVVAIVASLTGSTAAPVAVPPVVTAPVTSTTLICPSISSSPISTKGQATVADVSGALTPPSTSTGTVHSTVLAGAPRTTTSLHLAPVAVIASKPKVSPTVAVTATGSVAATIAADQVSETTSGRFRSLTDSRCEAAATDWWFAGANGNVGYNDTLTLANPSPTNAQVSIDLTGPKGTITNPRLDSLRVRPHNALHFSIASIAPDDGPLTIHVHATSGAVTAALLDRRTSALSSDGADYLPPTAGPARSAVVAGFAQSQGSQSLVLGNPGEVDANVALKLVTKSGEFTPTTVGQLVVPANRTISVNLDRGFGGSTGAVVVTSDQPVVAQGLSVISDRPQRPDLTWLAATAPLSGAAAVADGREPDGGHCLLLLSAPAAAGQVKVTTPGGQTQTISVPSRESVSVDITTTVKAGGGQSSFVVIPVGTAPVYGVRMLSFNGAHGALAASEPLVALPGPTVLPPVRSDPRVASH
jgi:hypothetical protein